MLVPMLFNDFAGLAYFREHNLVSVHARTTFNNEAFSLIVMRTQTVYTVTSYSSLYNKSTIINLFYLYRYY